MNRPSTLAAWLAYLETLHPKAIAMGLERVAAVHAKMDAVLVCPVVTVTGTATVAPGVGLSAQIATRSVYDVVEAGRA